MILPRRKFLHLAAGTAALPSLTCLAAAQDAYPSRPIHVVIGFTPGAAADVVARVFAQAASPILGQQLVVENKPGAGSSIAAEYVAHSAKDGYTVFLGTLSIITNQIINPNASLDLIRDFEPVALIQDAPIILVVNPASNIHSVKELIARCKARPEQALDSNVIGSMPHFASELFAQKAGIKLTQVPYQGSPQAVEDVVADRTLMTFSPVSTVVGLIAAGKLRALATTTGKRAGALPDVPTMAEAGLPDVETSLWFGLYVPVGTPRPIVDKLAAASSQAMHAPAAMNALRKQGDDPLDGGPDKFSAFMK
ncbi:MAG: tripartite tricarboxylate transporter substrate-binding protein, partial [Xanthobacteraceae bacterium]